MTLYLTDNTDAGRDRDGQGVGLRPRGQVLPGRRHDEFRFGRDVARARVSGARRDGDARPGAVAARRGHRRRRRRLRSRARVRRALARGDRARFPGPQGRARAHHDRARPRPFVAAAPARVAATITPQHLLYSRNALFAGGIRPHFYCLPVLKRETHRQALVAAATSGSPKFFLGTDSAPHARHTKENACGCAGCYTAPRGAGALRRGVRGRRRARPARGLREPLRRRLLRPAAQRRHGDAQARTVDGAGRHIRSASTRSCRCAPAKSCAGASTEEPPDSGILALRSQPDRRRPGNRGEESPGSAERDAG